MSKTRRVVVLEDPDWMTVMPRQSAVVGAFMVVLGSFVVAVCC